MAPRRRGPRGNGPAGHRQDRGLAETHPGSQGIHTAATRQVRREHFAATDAKLSTSKLLTAPASSRRHARRPGREPRRAARVEYLFPAPPLPARVGAEEHAEDTRDHVASIGGRTAEGDFHPGTSDIRDSIHSNPNCTRSQTWRWGEGSTSRPARRTTCSHPSPPRSQHRSPSTRAACQRIAGSARGGAPAQRAAAQGKCRESRWRHLGQSG
mmetsp:Transcript_65817/g.212315  ORF Transcript_65817/g.212315 Transcript_65817/m.212315 type:complete len:212 (-) Transcript_65817:18-653(-)